MPSLLIANIIIIGIISLIAIIRYRTMDTSYHPLALIHVLGFLNMVWTNYVALVLKEHNLVYYQGYRVIELSILLWQYYKWNPRANHRYYIFSCISVCIVLFLLRFVLTKQLYYVDSTLNVLASLVLCLVSIGYINQQIIRSQRNLWRDASVLFSITNVIFHSSAMTIEFFWLFGVTSSTFINLYIDPINQALIILCGLITILVFIWIPRKARFYLQAA